MPRVSKVSRGFSIFGLLGNCVLYIAILIFAVTTFGGVSRVTRAADDCPLGPLSDIGDPEIMADVRIAGRTLAAFGDWGTNEISLYDIADASAPRLLSTIRHARSGLHTTAIDEDRLLFGDDTKVYVLDISCPSSPIALATFDSESNTFPRAAAIQSQFVYVATEQEEITPPPGEEEGLFVFDARANRTPSRIAHLPRTNILDLAIDGNILYLLRSQRLEVVDIRVPAAPESLSLQAMSQGRLIAISKSSIYIAGGGNLDIFSRLDPKRPQLVKSIHYPNDGSPCETALRIEDGYLLLTTNCGQIFLFDLLDPDNPRLLSTGEFNFPVYGACTLDSRLYLATKLELKLSELSPCALFPTIFPVVASAPGANGAAYGSDLVLSNSAATDAVVTIAYWPRNEPIARRLETTITLGPFSTSRFDRILPTLFGIDDSAGPLFIHAPRQVSCRLELTENRFGRRIVVPPLSRRMLQSWELLIPGVFGNADFHANLGLINTASSAREVEVSLLLPSGDVVVVGKTILAPESAVQITDILATLPTSFPSPEESRVDLRIESSGLEVAAFVTETTRNADFSFLWPTIRPPASIGPSCNVESRLR